MAHPHCLRFITPHPNPPPNNAHRGHTMRAPLPLSLKLILPSNTIKLNRSQARLLCFNNFMADQGGGASTTETRPVEAAEKKQEEEAKQAPEKSEVPPPPEKPEPGDCCGSGCVRCVWDVYYDELEEYNNLYKTDTSSRKNN